MNHKEVAQYLQDNPSFFEENAELLAKIEIPHPHGGHAIPLVDRQMLGLREKNRALEAKLAELLQFGEENDVTSEKMHRLSGALLAGSTRDALLRALQSQLKDEFAIAHVALRLWGLAPREFDAGREEFAEVTDELKAYAASLADPYCGANNLAEAASWFGDATGQVSSVAHIPLRETAMAAGEGVCVGMLVLGSGEAARFYAGMGTLYLKRLGDLAGAGLSRFA